MSFEDGLASTEDFDGDFNDAFVAVTDTPLSRQALKELVEETGISRRVGTDGGDRLFGTKEDDQLIGLDGDDVIGGRRGDDRIEAGDGDDRTYGSEGDDECSGEEGNDRLFGGAGLDEIKGEEGNDWLRAGGGGARMSGGADDDTLIGRAAAKDTFVFDLIPFGDDRIHRFENGADRVEIATYAGVESFKDIEVTQEGSSTVLAFAEGTVEIANFSATRIDASDFLFV